MTSFLLLLITPCCHSDSAKFQQPLTKVSRLVLTNWLGVVAFLQYIKGAVAVWVVLFHLNEIVQISDVGGVDISITVDVYLI